MATEYFTISLGVGAALTGLAIGFDQKYFDSANPTHVLIVCAVAFLYAQTDFLAGVIASRQNAANARVLRALELFDDRLPQR
ncbi:MAG: hypothetical protein WD801_15135 [Gemmatimonadaceae bacterium]